MKFANLTLLLLIFYSAKTQTGFLDQTFGDNGKKLIYTNSYCYAIGVQSDGKIILGGAGQNDVSSGKLLIRLTSTGTIDSSFGINGFAILDFSQFGYGEILDLKVQEDGKIITTCGAGKTVLLARFKENGTLDSSFGDNGTASVSFDRFMTLWSLEIQKDGKYVFAGNNQDFNFNQRPVVLRFNHDGSLDENFGKNGQVVITTGDAFYAHSVKLQSDNKIVIGGAGFDGAYEFFIARLNPDGSLDSTFGKNGSQISYFTNSDAHINSIAIQADGKIVAAGPGGIDDNFAYETMTIARYNNDGTLDRNFGEKGITRVKFDDNRSVASTALIQPDGKIIVAGRVSDEAQTFFDFVLARLQPNGNLDSSFGVNGKQITDMGGSDNASDATLQPDYKILVAGYTQTDKNYYSVARYNNDAVMPLHFTYFNASPTNNGGIKLNWQTAQENNNNYFSVQRSGDSRFRGNDVHGGGANDNQFEIARINSQGNSSNAQTYFYTDNTPLQGTNFYRLKQVDKDGKFSYSQVVSATIANGLTVVLYPNPVKDVLNIKGLDQFTSYDLRITNVKGSLVAQTLINNISTYSWNLNSLSKGIYYLTIISNDKKTTVKFVKN